jgi:hypothetical protein
VTHKLFGEKELLPRRRRCLALAILIGWEDLMGTEPAQARLSCPSMSKERFALGWKHSMTCFNSSSLLLAWLLHDRWVFFRS